MRLLVIEDERTLAGHLRRGLGEAGWGVDLAHSAAEGRRLLRLNPYDVVLLDLGLPDADGLDLLRKLRADELTVPVLVLTARGSLAERVAGLEAGADDYLGKPFAFAELAARLQALFRRRHHRAAPVRAVGDLEIDLARRTVRRGDRAVEMTAREFDILELFVRHAEEVVTRTMLAEHVWGDQFDSLSNLIEVFINRLRRKTEEGGRPRLIHTVRGAGYVFRPVAP